MGGFWIHGDRGAPCVDADAAIANPVDQTERGGLAVTVPPGLWGEKPSGGFGEVS